MILISHRGNLNGKNTEQENSPEYILNALNEGFDVEIDVWLRNNKLYLGHDEPKYEIEDNFLENDKLWVHCKDIFSIHKLTNNKKIHCFYHENDPVTLTSKGYIWTFPGYCLGFQGKQNNSICVLPEISDCLDFDCVGLCSDFIKKYK